MKQQVVFSLLLSTVLQHGAQAALLRGEHVPNMTATFLNGEHAANVSALDEDPAAEGGQVTDETQQLEESITNMLKSSQADQKPGAFGAAKKKSGKGGGKTGLDGAIATMKKMVEDQMLPKVTEAHKAAQAYLDSLYDAFDACKGKMTSSMLGIPAAIKTQKKQSSNHKACRKGEAAKTEKAESCKAVQKAEEDAKKASCDAQDDLERDPNKEANSCHSNGGEKYDQWVDRIDDWISKKAKAYRKADKSCKDASSKAAGQKKTCDPLVAQSGDDKTSCDAMQEALETTTCTIATTANTACGEYAACFTAARSTLEGALPDIKKLEANRKAEWRALKRMMCLFDLFADGEAEEKEVDKCKGKTHNTDHLNLKYGKVPDPEKCASPVPDPCSAQYVSEEYSGLPAKAPAKECLACSGVATTIPLPDGFDVRCKHDTEWSYVLDYSDDRSKDDIPNDVAALASGFANSNAYYIGNSALDDLEIETAQMCVLSSTKKMKNGQCQWSCKTLDDGNFNAGVNCPGCKKLSSGTKKAIAGLTGQARGNDILQNLDPNIASFQEDMGDIGWMCGGYKRLHTWGAGWHSQGWGISMRPDHAPGQYEVGWYSDHCKFRTRVDVDTFQIRVQLKSKKIVVPKFSRRNFGVTVFQERCKHFKDWQYVLDYSDNRGVDDIPASKAVVASGFDTNNAYYIGNEKLMSLDIKEAEMCVLASNQKNGEGICPSSCFKITNSQGKILPELYSSFQCTECDKTSLGKDHLKKLIAGLSGQTTKGDPSTVMKTKNGIAPFSKPYQGVKWNCGGHTNIYHQGKGWHQNGWGISMNTMINQFTDIYEVGWYSDHCKYISNNKLDVDTFQVRVRT